MKSYVFTANDGNRPSDLLEMELADLQAARIEAARLFGAMIANEPEDFWSVMEWRLSVKNREGLLLFELHAVAIEAPAAQGGPMR